MTTALEIIEPSLRKIHVLGRGQILPNEQAQDALSALNSMIASWSVEGNLVFTETSETFNLTGAGNYSIGSGADFDTVRPVEIESVYVSNGETDYFLEQYDQNQYARVTDKSVSGIPNVFYYDANYPTANIYFLPIPTSAQTVTINSKKPLTAFPDLTTDISLPPGYDRALIYNLSVEQAPEYEKEPSRAIIAIAEESKSALITANTRNDNHVMRVDPALNSGGHGRFNIYRGY